MPEETLMLSAPNSEMKNVWFQALQKSIVEALQYSASPTGLKVCTQHRVTVLTLN